MVPPQVSLPLSDSEVEIVGVQENTRLELLLNITIIYLFYLPACFYKSLYLLMTILIYYLQPLCLCIH